MKLDFVCIGAQKAGTTTLHDILNTHPNIYLPPRKEAQFFDINERYEKGLDYYYSNFFNTYNNEDFIGNINPNLQLENRSIDRLIKSCGNELKIIFVLRNPIERAFSHYLMSKRRGYEHLSFSEALKKEDYRLNHPQKYEKYISDELGHYEKNHYGYKYRSSYSRTIKHLYSSIPKENIQLILFEDLVKNKKATIKQILTFLNIPIHPQIAYDVESNRASKPKSTLIRDLIYQPNNFKNRIGKILSKEKKEFIKRKLNALNNRPLGKSEKMLSNVESTQLHNLYFKNEIEELEKLIENSLEKWKP